MPVLRPRHSILILILLGSLLCMLDARQQPVQDQAGALYFQAGLAFRESRFEDAARLYIEAALAYEKAGLPLKQSHALIRAGEMARTLGDLKRAKGFLYDADTILAGYSAHARLRGEAAHLRSNLLSDEGRYEEAIQEMQRAIRWKLAANTPHDSSIALSYNNIGYNYYYLERTDSALHYYRKAISLAEAGDPGSDRLNLAMYYQNAGIIFALQGRLDTALNYLVLSSRIRERFLPDDDPDLGYTYTNLGRLYRMLGDNIKAYEYNNKAEQVYIKHFGNDYPGLGTLYLNLGNILNVMGDYEKAISYYKQSLHIYLGGSNPRHHNIARLYNNLGAMYLELGADSMAASYLQQSLKATDNPVLALIALRNLARLHQERKEYAIGKAYLDEGMALSKNKIDTNHYEYGNLLLDYGSLLKEMGTLDEALLYAEKGTLFFQRLYGHAHPDLSSAMQLKADIFMAQGDFREALHQYHEALRVLVPDLTDTSYLENPKVAGGLINSSVLGPIIGKASCLRALAGTPPDPLLLRQSLEVLLDASEIVDGIRNQLTDQSKQLITGTVRKLYENGINTALRLYAQSKDPELLQHAFGFMERSKYAVLNASMRDAKARAFAGIPDSLTEIERNIRDRITAYTKMVYEENLLDTPDAGKLANWESKLFGLRKEQEALVQQIETDFPRYYHLKYSTDILALEDIRQQIGPDEALIEYFLGDSTLYSLYITRDEIASHSRPVDSTLANDINLLRSAMDPSVLSKLNLEEYNRQQRASHRLYNQLLAPGAKLIEDKRLLIVPDDILGYLSFDLLLSKPHDSLEMDYRKLAYLIREHEIGYTYLAGMYFQQKTKTRSARREVYAFAPTYDHIDSLDPQQLVSLRGMERYLLPLAHAREEMEILKAFPGARIFMDKEATEAGFKANAGKPGIIHLAMHTIIDDRNPMLSRLVFTLTPEEAEEDGLLNTYEIYGMDFNARMVVLSACNTGQGMLQRGEGIISMARAFMYAGVPGIVMTLWSVEDHSGFQIMEKFYHHLSEGKTRRQALRDAKLEFLGGSDRLHAHPYFWAAYVTIGDDRPVFPKNEHTAYILAVCIVAAGGGLLFYLKRRKRKRRMVSPSGS